MTLKPMPGVNDKAYTWFAEDFSEGEVEHTNFAIRFKTADIATHFKDLISYAKEGKEIPEHLKHVPETVPSSPSISNQKTPVKSPVQAEMQSVPVQSPSQTFHSNHPRLLQHWIRRRFLVSNSARPRSAPVCSALESRRLCLVVQHRRLVLLSSGKRLLLVKVSILPIRAFWILADFVIRSGFDKEQKY